MESLESLVPQEKALHEIQSQVKKTLTFTSFKKTKTKGTHEEAYKRRIRREKMLTAKEKKHLKVFTLPKEGHKYTNYLPLHTLWSQYMSSILDKNLPKEGFEAKLLKADFHGAKITVDKSKCPTLIGISGILIQETENTMKIVTQDDELKVVPKRGCIFSFIVLEKKVEIFGNHILYRASERSVKKFKGHPTLEL